MGRRREPGVVPFAIAVATIVVASAPRLSWSAGKRRLPLLLLLEDIHWADRDSLDLLRYVARSVTEAPLGLFVTYRPEDVDRSPGLGDYLPVLLREANWTRLTLAPLDRPSVEQLLRGRFGDLQAGQEELAAQVYQRTGGNRFFLGEYLHLLDEQGLLPGADRLSIGDMRAAPATIPRRSARSSPTAFGGCRKGACSSSR